jgi:Zn-dependent protease with chaperone function
MFQMLMTVFRVLLKIPYVKNHPKVLKLDRYLEEKIGLDLIKQEKKWFEKHPLLEERIKALEEDLDDLYLDRNQSRKKQSSK